MKKTMIVLCSFMVVGLVIYVVNKFCEYNSGTRHGNHWGNTATSDTAIVDTYVKTFEVGSEWTGVEIEYGWSLSDRWGDAPLDVRINKDPNRVVIAQKGIVNYGNDVCYKEWRLNPKYKGTATVTCIFKRANS